ncbi:MAG: mechanosensitive ion channel family protein [bacterium]
MNLSSLSPQKMLEHLSQWAPVVLRIFLIFVISWVIWWLLSRLISRITTRAANSSYPTAQRVNTLSSLMQSVLGVGILTLAVTLVLGELGINLGPVIAAAGIVGLAIGFGAQSLVKDVLNGFFFLLEGHVRIGDVIEAAGKTGLAEQITLRTLVLRDFEGRVHVIPHGEITTVTNLTKDYSRALINVGVAYREDHDFVMQLLQEEGEKLRNDPNFSRVILDGPEVFGIDAFNDSDLLFKVRFMTKPLEQWNVARAYRRMIKRRFDQEGVEIPFPHTTLYFGAEKDGTAPPAFIRLASAEAKKLVEKTSPEQILRTDSDVPLPDGGE